MNRLLRGCYSLRNRFDLISSNPGQKNVFPSRHYHHDQTLEWAKANPSTAQQCLQPPAWTVEACNSKFQEGKGQSLEGYLNWRKWPNTCIDGNDNREVLRERATAIVSHVLSAPLTLAAFSIHSRNEDAKNHICCIGARAEATIPFDIWKEYLLFVSASISQTYSATVDFVGPDILAKPGNTPDQTISIDNGSTAILRWAYKGFFHHMLAANRGEELWDGFAFFNPGFGHPNLKENWKPTIYQVLPLGHSMLLTAHSEKDAERDSKALMQDHGLTVEYFENPFASRISYLDPFDETHLVRPNHFVAHVIMS